ncbi:nitroreductase family protein [Halorarum halobium]|uniref:nitroreductase family protein n=1 Tax=Halorarum halobium TaxID=3075121 RepID=UPI0028AC9096|nr:nitroreductase family protein [Halobaculum sp. XH14]
MEYDEVIHRRRMVRNFREDPIDEGATERIVTAGLQGPSAGFSQGFGFLVLESPEDRERFWSTNEHNVQPERVRRAPLVVVPFACKDDYLDRYAEPDKGWTDREESRWPVPYWYIDTGMAALNVLHAAVAEGLGALFFGIPDEDWPALRDAFSVPEAYDPIGAITVGHPADERIEGSGDTRRRKDVEEHVHGGDWGDTFR